MNRGRGDGALSELELLVLSAVVGLGDERYGLAVRQAIAARTGREIAIGSVYRCLAGLERKGLVQSWTGNPVPTRGGRAKRYFEVTGAGERALRRTVADLRSLTAGLDLGWETA